MPTPPLIQMCSWPGVQAIESCTYTASHGISPGTAYLRMYPQTAAIQPRGNLLIGDGVRLYRLAGLPRLGA